MLPGQLIQALLAEYPRLCLAGGTAVGHIYPERLEGAVGAAFTRVGMTNLDGDPVVLAAYVLWYIARDHPATDGNKRLALAAAQIILGSSGFVLDSTRRTEVIGFVTDVAKGATEIEDVARRLAELVT